MAQRGTSGSRLIIRQSGWREPDEIVEAEIVSSEPAQSSPFPRSSTASQNWWNKNTFEQVNNGRHPDFTLPRRIDIGLWAALDVFHERAALSSTHCPVCKRRAASVPGSKPNQVLPT